MNHPPRQQAHRTTDGGGSGKDGETAKRFIDQQFAALQATIPAAGEMLADGNVRTARAAVETMSATLAPKARTVLANDHQPAVPYHVAIREALCPGLPAGEAGRFFAESRPLREALDGPVHSHQVHAPGSPERRKILDKHRKRDDDHYQPDRGLAMHLATLRAIAAAYDPESITRATKAACEIIERQAQARAKEREFAVERLRRDIEASLTAAIRRHKTDGDTRMSRAKAKAVALATMSIAPVDQATLRAEREALLAERPVGDPRREAAGKHIRGLVASMRALVDRRHGGDKAGKATPVKREQAVAARTMATGLARHRDAIFERWNSAPNATGGAIGYLTRSRPQDLSDDQAKRIRGAINAAHGKIVKGTFEERDRAAEGEQREAHDRPSMRDLISPQEHRVDARKRHRREALEAGVAQPAAYDKQGNGVADVPSATRIRAEALNRRALLRALELGRKAMRSKKVREQIRRRGCIAPARSFELNGASLIHAPSDCDLTNPLVAAKSFMAGLDKPLIHPGHMKPRKSEPEKRLAHFVYSLPKKSLPPELCTDHALMGGALSRLRLIGIDARKHRCMVFRHDDAADDGCIHLHLVVDRVRSDGKMWDLNGIDRTAACNAASNAMCGLFLDKHGESNAEPTFLAPVARTGPDGSGHVHHRSMLALEALAEGKLRCELKWQSPDKESGEIAYSPKRSPYHGKEDDDSEDAERDLGKSKAMREALILAGHDGIMPGFLKVQDGFWSDLSQPLEEKTTNNPAQTGWWRFLNEEPRPVVGWEHLFRILAEHI